MAKPLVPKTASKRRLWNGPLFRSPNHLADAQGIQRLQRGAEHVHKTAIDDALTSVIPVHLSTTLGGAVLWEFGWFAVLRLASYRQMEVRRSASAI